MVFGTELSTHFLQSRENSAVVSCRLSKDTWIKHYLHLWMPLLQRGTHSGLASHGRQIYSFCLWLHVGDNKRRDQMTLFPPIKTLNLIPGKSTWVNPIQKLYLFILLEIVPQEDKQLKTLQEVGKKQKTREKGNNSFQNPSGKADLVLHPNQGVESGTP